ncbi:hypothetical protein GGI13_001367 [Coemansia sp. RSA 455]|nr:hypothetical protein GGI13_001367 [Coemansia sp. RSA 455]
MFENIIIVLLLFLFYLLSRVSAGPPTDHTQLDRVPSGSSPLIGKIQKDSGDAPPNTKGGIRTRFERYMATVALRVWIALHKRYPHPSWRFTDVESEGCLWDGYESDFDNAPNFRDRSRFEKSMSAAAVAAIIGIQAYLAPPEKQVRLDMPSADDMYTSDDMPDDGADAPSVKERSSFDGHGSVDNSLAQLVSAEISANVVTRHCECKDCSRNCMELHEAKLEMVSALRSCQSHGARRNTDYDVLLSRRLRDVLLSAIEAFRVRGYNARCHAWTHYHDYATPATGKSTAATSAPANDTSAAANTSSVGYTSAGPAIHNNTADTEAQVHNASAEPSSGAVGNAASAHITGEAVKTSSATNTSEPPGNNSVGCSTPAKPKRATDNPSQQDIEEAFRRKEWRPSSFGRYPNSKRGRRRKLRRNASVFKNMAHVPTQQRAHSTLRKRVAALVRHVGTNTSSVTGCLPGDRPPAARTQTMTLPAAPTPPASFQSAMPLGDTAPSGPSQTVAPPADTSTVAHTLTAASSVAPTTPAPSLVAAASTASTTAHTQTAMSPAAPTPPASSQTATSLVDATPAPSYQVAAPSAPSNNGASLGLNPAGQGATEEHTPTPPVNFTAYRLPSKTRAPTTGVRRARQTPSFIARRLQKVVVVKQRNPADRSKIRRIAIPIRTRQSLKGRYRSLATRHDLGRLGLGFRTNGVSVRQRFTNSAGVVRLGSGMTLRDNRLRRRRRTSSLNEIRASQRQRARKEMRASQRLLKYPATTPDINVIPATPPAIPSGGGATGWFPVGWSNFGQGARTDITTPAHVQLATTPAPPTLPGPTQTITPIDPTQATFMTATPTPPTAFAPTGFAQTIIPPAAPTGFAPTQATIPPAAPTGFAPTGFTSTNVPPTTTATASPASNAPTQAGMTLPPPISTGPAPPVTTFTFASTSGPSRTQPQTNVSALRGSGSRGRQSGRLGNRPGNGAAKQQAKTPGALEATFDIEEVAELTDLKEEHPDVMQKYPWILWRRQRIGPKIATENTWLIDRMYYALLRLAATRAKYVANFDLEKELRILGEANDGTIVARHREESDGENINAIEGVDVSALRGGVFC